MRRWLDNSTGIGHVVTGMEHSFTNGTGTAWGPLPWRGAQAGEEPQPPPGEDVILH